MNCPNCGKEIGPGWGFCGECGTPVEKSPTAPSIQPGQLERPVQAERLVQPAQPVQAERLVQPTQPVQSEKPKKKRGVAPIIGGVVAAVVVVALLWVAVSRNASQAPDSASPAGAAQQTEAELIPHFAGTWKLSGVAGKRWDPSAEELEGLWTRGFAVFLTLDEDGTAQLDVFGTPMQATWKPASENRMSIRLGSDSRNGALEGEQLTFESGEDKLSFTKASAGEVTSARAAESPKPDVTLSYLFDLTKRDTYLIEQPAPENGAVLYDDGQLKMSEITITGPASTPCYVKLKDTAGNDVMAWWVSAGQTATVQVPGITGELVYATGGTWYGVGDLFGEGTSYSKPDDVLDLATYTYEFVFQLTYGGNLSSKDIDAEEF